MLEAALTENSGALDAILVAIIDDEGELLDRTAVGGVLKNDEMPCESDVGSKREGRLIGLVVVVVLCSTVT